MYAFAEDAEREGARLRAVERALDPPTVSALTDAGIGPGWFCWEVGAGHGSIARWLEDAVGADGVIVATDVDDRWYEGDAPLMLHDVAREPPPGTGFDLVHARLVLEHLTEPRAVVEVLAGALRPGGVLVLEDAAGLRFAGAPVFDRIAERWERAGRAAGWDARYGAELIEDMRAAGLGDVRGREHRLVAPGGPGWLHVQLGIDRLRAELAAEGVTSAEVDEVLAALADPATVITGGPVVTAWGMRPSRIPHRDR